jgi:hypothetical protein
VTDKPRLFVPPRFGTPRDPGAQTYGGQIAAMSEKFGEPFMPHQRHMADVAYELEDDGKTLKYDEVVITAMRQVGKTSLVRAKSIWRVTAGQTLFDGDQSSAYLAQKRQDARKKLQRDFVPKLRAATKDGDFHEVKDSRSVPQEATEWKLSMNNGQEQIMFGPSSFLQIETPNREAGHGDTLDDATIDEAFAHRDDEIEQAINPTMLTRFGKQLWIMSAAGDESSFFFWPRVRDGRKMIESGKKSNIAYFEYSIPDDADIDDEDVWWEFHPALGRTIQLDTLRRELAKARRRSDDGAEDLFRRSNCNQWVRIPIMTDDDKPKEIDPAVWKSRREPRAKIVGEIALGIDTWSSGKGVIGSFNTHYISVAGQAEDGRYLIEVIHEQTGLMGMEDKIMEAVERFNPVRIAWDDSAAHALSPIVKRVLGDDPKKMMRGLNGREWTTACVEFKNALIENRLCHLDQDWLTFAVEGAQRITRGGTWLWDRVASTADISPLCASTAALWAIINYTPENDEGFYVY